MSIYDLFNASEIAAYWTLRTANMPPFIGAELFPARKQLGINAQWMKGGRGMPQVIKASAFDAFVIPRQRVRMDLVQANMPFFKESLYIDEEMRQTLNQVAGGGNQAVIDMIMMKWLDDASELIEGAAATRERLRMMALTSGVIAFESNGQSFVFDYGVKNKGDASVAWTDYATSQPLADIDRAKQAVANTSGATVTRAMLNAKTWGDLRASASIRGTLLPVGSVGIITDGIMKQFMYDNLGIDFVVNDKRYKDEEGQSLPYVPDDTVVLFPSGPLGSTVFGTTPEESDLMSFPGSARVAIVDTGIAITTMPKADPVNIETKVSGIFIPTFESSDGVYIMDTSPN